MGIRRKFSDTAVLLPPLICLGLTDGHTDGARAPRPREQNYAASNPDKLCCRRRRARECACGDPTALGVPPRSARVVSLTTSSLQSVTARCEMDGVMSEWLRRTDGRLVAFRLNCRSSSAGGKLSGQAER